DRIMIIIKGKIVADGTSANLRKQAQGREILKISIEEGDVNDIFKALQGIETVGMVDFISKSNSTYEIQSKPELSSRRAVFDMCVAKGWYLTEMTSVETKLEDVFRELTMN
ncbi:MAG: gliding motility-associated ABC transporter ATP-binding subunit GldA, partial [Bacteroidales bacterium]|nr:gliding motility-associated ABC transporter ATP-binding subunit GldA [Bacteroidales bacterium]